MRFQGIIPVVVTWFTKEEELDLKTQAAHLDFLIAAGVDGLFIQGSASEFAYMTLEERKRHMHEVMAHVAGRLPVLVGVSANSTREAEDLARAAEQAGADGVMAVSPYYWILDEEALITHFARIGASTSLPLLAYNFPLLTGHDLSAPLLQKLLQAVPNLAGIKNTVDCLSHTREIIQTIKPIRPEFTVLAGYDEYLLPTLAAGGDGIIGATPNFAPEVTVSLKQAFDNKDFEQMIARHRQVCELMKVFSLAKPAVAAIKEAAVLAGIQGNPEVRPPLPNLTEQQKKAVKDCFQAV
ncbi:MAG: dihydrodipicolinate synthase family protein [Desulfohalobiaceae bacterium]|nr:dihydrodipicolinate synthase family protein [Desulfohalobiaceae bacterium]